ncbi:MAG: hypothetical protein ACRELY_30195, partial [Polyangiaceae bacterium]
MRATRVAAPFFVLGVLAATPAFAGDTAAAQVLFSDARKLMAAGNYADACPKLDESEKQDPGMGTLYNLGDCYEHVGKTASAWAAFDEVANEARAAAEPTREQDARARANALSPQLAHLTVDASAVRTLPGLKIRRDGEDIGAPEWGNAIPVDPGEHTITATATGKIDWSSTVIVHAHEGAVATVPLLENAPVAPPPPTGAYGPTPAVERTSDGSSQRTIGIAVAGVGVLALGTGMVLGLMSKSEESTANNDGCRESDNFCANQQAVNERSTALVEGNVSSVLAIAGLVVATGGIVLWA